MVPILRITFRPGFLWKIQLWTFKDCLEFCIKDLPDEIYEITIHDIEPIIIRQLSPVLNVIYNSLRTDTTQGSENEGDYTQLQNALDMSEEIGRFLNRLHSSPKTIFAYRNALEQFVKTVIQMRR